MLITYSQSSFGQKTFFSAAVVIAGQPSWVTDICNGVVVEFLLGKFGIRVNSALGQVGLSQVCRVNSACIT